MSKIKERERTAIINSLKAGVVPSIGLQHIQVGRSNEVKEIINDLSKVTNEGASIRLVMGEYGSGKTFFLTLSSTLAQKKNFVTTRADITTEKTLYSRDGKAQRLYSELMKNLATITKPQGGALKTIIERGLAKYIGLPDEKMEEEVKKFLRPLEDLVSAYDFSEILLCYLKGYREDNSHLCECSLRWLRGEYQTKTDAKRDLPVKSIINDTNYYDYLKLMAQFVELVGYSGLQVSIDELAVLSRFKSNVRNNNYETILKILNDSLQGNASYLQFLLGGTPDFVKDKRKGLYSYGALETRLSENPFSTNEFKDYSGIIIELENLTPEELFVVFDNIRKVFAYKNKDSYLIDDEGIKEFLKWCYKKMGAESFLSPREAIKDFVGLLSILENYPEKSLKDFIEESDSLEDQENVPKKIRNFKL